MRNVRILLVPIIATLLATLPGVPYAGAQEAPRAISLGDALREVQQTNPALRVSREHLRAAEAGVKEAQSALLPNLAIRFDYTRHQEENLVVPMHEPPSPANPLPFDDRIYTGVVRLDIPILDLGTFAAVGSARQTVEYNLARTAEDDQKMLANVADLFIRYRRLEDNRVLLDTHLAVLQRRYDELSILEEAGRVSPAVVAEVESSITSLQSDRLLLTQGQREIAWRLGSLLAADEPVVPIIGETDTTAGSPRLGPANVTMDGPRVATARAQLEDAQARYEAVQRSFLPRIDGFVTQTARSGSDLDFATEWSAGVGVTIPLLTGGERMARLDRTDAGRSAAEQAYEAARQEHRADLRVEAERWENLHLRRDLINRAIRSRQVSVEAVTKQYEEGRASLSDLLAEEAQLLELRMQEKTLHHDQLNAYIAYHQRLGNLSATRIETLLEEQK